MLLSPAGRNRPYRGLPASRARDPASPYRFPTFRIDEVHLLRVHFHTRDISADGVLALHGRIALSHSGGKENSDVHGQRSRFLMKSWLDAVMIRFPCRGPGRSGCDRSCRSWRRDRQQDRECVAMRNWAWPAATEVRQQVEQGRLVLGDRAVSGSSSRYRPRIA